MATTTFNDVRQILARWDKGSINVRRSMLEDFIDQCENMTASELEQQFCDCASLFLARLTAWLRLSHMKGTCLGLQLKAVDVFVASASGQHFLTEFLEVGGMLTVLEVVAMKSAKEEHKEQSLLLLTTIANKGRQYKELLCESYGVKLVAECLALSSSVDTQECARNLLYQLSTGNPRYQSQVYKALIALLSSVSTEAQRMAAHTLRLIQPSMGVASASIVDPVLQLLKNLHLSVQHEATELLNELVDYEEIQQPILIGLVNMLKPSEDGTAPKALEAEGSTTAPLPVYIQQAAASRVINVLATKNDQLGEKLIEFPPSLLLTQLRVVPHLLYAMGNKAYVDSQRQASITLAVFVSQFLSIKSYVESLMGRDFFQTFVEGPEKLYDILTPSQIDVLVSALSQDLG